VLKLATMWNFTSVRETAIEGLSLLPLTPSLKLVLAHTYDIKEWVRPTLNQVAQLETLEEENAERIAQATSWSYVMKIVKVRESLTKPTKSYGCGLANSALCVKCRRRHSFDCGNEIPRRSEHDFTAIIRTVFKLE
jgi:hypothetical protein